VPGLNERLFDGPDEQSANQLGIAKSHIRLCRVHIDIHLRRIQVEKENDDGVPVSCQHIGIGAAQSGQQQFVLYRPAVDKKELMLGIAAMMSRQTGKSGQVNSFPRRIYFHRVFDEFLPEYLGDPRKFGFIASCGRPALRLPVNARNRETDFRIGQSDPFDDIRDRRGFRAVGFQKLQSGRGRKEQVSDLNQCSAGTRGRCQWLFPSPFDRNRPGMIFFPVTGLYRQPRHGADGWQGFSTKSESPNIEKVIVGYLGCTMSADCQYQVVLAHAFAVIGNAHERLPTGSGHDLDVPRSGINGIFNQFLDDAGGPLDYFAGRNLVDHLFAKLPDLHETPFTRFRTASCSYMVRAEFVPILSQLIRSSTIRVNDMTVSAPLLIDGLRAVAPFYKGVLCDVWGVLHNGVAAFEEAHKALRAYRKETGGKVVLITNAPRPAKQVGEMLAKLGVPEEAYDDIVTSGDVTRAILEEQGNKTLLHLGPNRDQPLYWNLEATFTTNDDEAEAISCTGLVDDERETPDDYRDRLQKLADRKLLMICANPDIVVERGDRLVWCGGALARLYEDLGGEVAILGKPHAPIYHAAMERLETLAGEPISKEDVLAIGDGLPTDIRGAVSQDIDVLFITAGIHASDFGPSDAPEEHLIRKRLIEEGLRARAALPRLWW